MKRLRILRIFLMLATFLFMIGIVSAAPQITIHSPESMAVYDSTKIFLNITSNEAVDFFIKGPRGEREMILAENATSLTSYLYLKEGEHEFKIWARNTNGETNASVIFNSSVSNPVHIDSCGYLYSSDTEYVLDNDISGGDACIGIFALDNVFINLSGKTVHSEGSGRTVVADWSSNVDIFNGAITGSPTCLYWQYPTIIEIEGTGFRFKDLSISGFIGLSTWPLHDVVFENVTINSSIVMWFDSLSDVYFKNSTLVWNGAEAPSCHAPLSTVFWSVAAHSEIILEEVKIEGFNNNLYMDGASADFFLRSTELNISKAVYNNWHPSSTRLFKQHKVLFNVMDQLNRTGSGVIEIQDSNQSAGLGRYRGSANPTRNALLATNENGTAETWLTEKLYYGRTGSPLVVEEIVYSPYNITVKTWTGEDSTFQLNFTTNSTIPMSINIVVPTELPECTPIQLLDINNDGNITIEDATIILRQISGLPVSYSGDKECAGISLNPY